MIERVVESRRLRLEHCPKHPQEYMQDGYCHACAWRATQGLPVKEDFNSFSVGCVTCSRLETAIFVTATFAGTTLLVALVRSWMGW